MNFKQQKLDSLPRILFSPWKPLDRSDLNVFLNIYNIMLQSFFVDIS